MEIEVPDWLTKEFIKHALENGKESESITVKNIEVEKPLAKGDNYMCEIFRVQVDYQEFGKEPSKTSLIVKSPIVGPMYESMLKMGVIQKESRVYNEYLPKVNEIFGGEKLLTPKTYHSDQDNVLVMEDLKFEGYIMADRRRQLDFDHCVVALKSLACYHAVSVKLHEQEPNLVEDVGREVFFNEDFKDTNQGFSKIALTTIADEVKDHELLGRYKDRFLNVAEKAWDYLLHLLNPKNNSFNVLNHGDFWVNNMLFRYENDKPVDVKLIDLQIARYTSPAVDLCYFFYGSVQEELRETRLDELLTIYLNELNSHLEKLGVMQRLSESELKHMMDKSEIFALFVTVSLFPIVIANPNNVTLDMKEVDVEHFKDKERNPFRNFYKNNKFLDILVNRMAKFEKKHWFSM